MKATTIWKAFFLGSLIMAIVSVASIETRKELEKLGWFNNKPEIIIALITFVISFLIGLTSYLIMYFLFGYGGGMIIQKRKKKKVN
jgi:uncharacterized membrane protein YbhN (UPF0104 family)